MKLDAPSTNNHSALKGNGAKSGIVENQELSVRIHHLFETTNKQPTLLSLIHMSCLQ
jgi:hypothetical protein